jgi:hypothetical protein
LYQVKQKYDPTHAFTFAQEVRSPGLDPIGPVLSFPPQLEAALNQPIDYSGGMKAAPKQASS